MFKSIYVSNRPGDRLASIQTTRQKTLLVDLNLIAGNVYIRSVIIPNTNTYNNIINFFNEFIDFEHFSVLL